MRAKAVLIALLGSASIAASSPASDGGTSWRAMTEQDLAFATNEIEAQYIGAVYPSPHVFAQRLDALNATARAESARVTDFAGYRATLNHFFNGLDDEHDAVSFSIGQTRLFWPGFVATYVGHRYLVTASTRPGIPTGASITSCDDASIEDLTTRVAAYEGGHTGLESTKASAAVNLFIDRGTPFIARPKNCVIAGRSTALEWSRIRYPDYARIVQPLMGVEDRTVAITPFGKDGAWVRLGYFEPDNTAEADTFRKVNAQAATIRDKTLIVLDVRQNGGGPYNWFMDFLRGLYGQPYADYYARARLQIRPVYRATPEILAEYRASDAQDATLGQPKDGPRGDPSTLGIADALTRGEKVFHLPPPPGAHPPIGPAPANPVRASVVVLTDYGCASACIAFVDELKRFPGVKQVGVETFVDNRTGTALFEKLPSGNGTMMVATMTRDGRERGDNVPQKPDIEFPGDIADTAAVKAWVHDVVAPQLTRR